MKKLEIDYLRKDGIDFNWYRETRDTEDSFQIMQTESENLDYILPDADHENIIDYRVLVIENGQAIEIRPIRHDIHVTHFDTWLMLVSVEKRMSEVMEE